MLLLAASTHRIYPLVHTSRIELYKLNLSGDQSPTSKPYRCTHIFKQNKKKEEGGKLENTKKKEEEEEKKPTRPHIRQNKTNGRTNGPIGKEKVISAC